MDEIEIKNLIIDDNNNNNNKQINIINKSMKTYTILMSLDFKDIGFSSSFCKFGAFVAGGVCVSDSGTSFLLTGFVDKLDK